MLMWHVVLAAMQIKFYLALEKGLFTDMAAKTAAALQGMSPKINIWTQGGAGGEVGAAGDPMAPLRNLFTSLPPMLVGNTLSMLLLCAAGCSGACRGIHRPDREACPAIGSCAAIHGAC